MTFQACFKTNWANHKLKHRLLSNKLHGIGSRIHAMESAITGTATDKFTMFPKAPNLSKFIDAFHGNEADLNRREKLEKSRQEEYHAEVRVFRALENLNDTKGLYFVLHSLKYTHEQYEYFVDDHDVTNCSKKPQEDEGECDFIAVFNACFVVLEVKSPNKDSKNRPKMFRDGLKESIVQRKRTVKLLQGMAKRYGLSDPLPVILDFTIFCGLTRDEAGSLVQSNFAEDLSEIVFEDDLPNFAAWWDVNVGDKFVNSCAPDVLSLLANNKTLYQKKITKMHRSFLGLWISHMQKGNPNSHSQGLAQGLAQCIIQIDKVLRSEIITRKPGSPINREIKVAPPVFKNHLGIECLTVEQMNTFKCKKNHICINGPAGSGKTVVLLGKMLDLAKKEEQSERKILVLAFGEYSGQRYEEACYSASINNLTIPLTTEKLLKTGEAPPPEQQDLMVKQHMVKCVQDSFQKKPLYKVAIMYNLANMLSIVKLDIFSVIFDLFPDHHILVDDGQCIFSHDWGSVSEAEGDVHGFLEYLKKRAVVQKTDVWLSYDPVQYYYNKFITQLLPSCVGPSPPADSLVVVEAVEPKRSELNKRLATHFQGSMVVLRSNLRNTEELASILSFLREKIMKGFRNDVDVPSQEKGHYIHGFKPTIYFLNSETVSDFVVLNKWEYEKIKFLAPHHRKLIVELKNHEKYSHYFMDAAQEYGKNNLGCIPSAEWPAVTAVLDTNRQSLESFVIELYLLISRARVYCTVFVLDCPYSPIHEEVLEFEKELVKYAHVIRLDTPEASQMLLNDRNKMLLETRNELEKSPDVEVRKFVWNLMWGK